ncbi:MAG: 50S ribosomal protein L21 [Candidatus Roizmanbacteria bacterium]
MNTLAVIKSGGKQYIVKAGDVITVDKIDGEVGAKVELVKLANISTDGSAVELGMPHMKSAVSAEIVESGKGTKIRVAKFKAKVRYRRVTGFRPMLSKLKILSI